MKLTEIHYTVMFIYNYEQEYTYLGSVVEWLKHRTDDQHGLGSKPLAPFCCVLGKDTLRHFLLLGGLDKQF